MKIIGLTTVRNEEDIIAQSLRYAAQQMDLILVVDCGSIDNSVAEIQKVCQEFNHVIFLGELGAKHARQVRRHIWEKFRHYLSWDDWWAVVDADEFAELNLREKVEIAAREFADHIWSIHANFYYTESEAKRWYENKETIQDRLKPIEERRRFYRMHTSQQRLFRNLPWLRWHSDTSWPDNFSKPASQRIVYRHYQYRDIPQIELRLQTRSQNKITSDLVHDNPHWFYKKVEQAISSDKSPNLKQYIPGQPLEVDKHLPPLIKQNWLKSAAKYVFAISKSLQKQAPSQLFADINPKEVISKMRKPSLDAKNINFPVEHQLSHANHRS